MLIELQNTLNVASFYLTLKKKNATITFILNFIAREKSQKGKKYSMLR